MKQDWQLLLRRVVLPAAVFLILLAAAVVRFSNLIEKTREGTTIGRLSELRQAILLYYQDHSGTFPHELSPSGPFGRYLSKIPAVGPLHPRDHSFSPAGNQIAYGAYTPQGYGQGWYYNTESGQVFINSIGTDSRGNSYTTY